MSNSLGNGFLSQWDFEYSFKFEKREDNFTQLWAMKSSARESLKDWLSVSNISSETSEVCANACSELIENCVKYTPNRGTAAVAICVTDATIQIDTINTAGDRDKVSLEEFIAAINTCGEIKQLFVEKLLHPVEGESHLGLVKIVMETRGRLELIPEKERDLVHIRLQMNVE